MALLTVENLSLSFAGLRALAGVSFAVNAGEIVGLIGPNGAGKTTLLNCISRLYTPQSGRILLDGVNLLDVPIHGVAAHGIARTFQNLELFAGASVLENVAVNSMRRFRSTLVAELLSLPSARRNVREARKAGFKALEALGLDRFAKQRTSDLPYGTQKTVELARALAGEPKLLLLDEPAAGLNPDESRRLGTTIRSLRDRGMTVLLIEHDMRLVMDICERIVVLDHGEKIHEGTPDTVRRDPAVISAYLGAEADDA